MDSIAAVKKLIVAISIVILSSSCSQLIFRSSEKIPLAMGHHQQGEHLFTVHSSRDFYLWGLFPQQQIIDMDKELAELGVSEAVILKFGLDPQGYWKGKLITLVTFGMYRPEYFFIKAKGVKTND